MRARVVLLVFLLSAAAPTSAVTFVVNSTAEGHDAIVGDGKCETVPGNGVCTLRAALDEANATTGALIQIPALTITLAYGELQIEKPMTITGAGAGKTVISGNNTYRVVNDKVDSAEVHLNDVTLRDGASDTIGGIVECSSQAYLFMVRCEVVHGSAPSAGCIHAHVLEMTDSSVSDCHATSSDGGALYVLLEGILTRTTVSGGVTAGRGGGIYSAYATMRLVNSTVSDNNASSYGGGVYSGGSLDLYNVTIAGNRSDVFAGGGGVSNPNSASATTFLNTLFSGNLESNGQMPFPTLIEAECSGAVTSNGYSIMLTGGTPHCSISGAAMTFVDDALIGPLQGNGGYAPTRALLAGSPAIDAGNPGGCSGSTGTLTTDQRGVHRPIGSACDIGSYERAPCGDVNGDGLVNVTDIFFLINYLFAGGQLPPGVANVDGNASTDVNDVFSLINSLFAGGPAPSCPGT